VYIYKFTKQSAVKCELFYKFKLVAYPVLRIRDVLSGIRKKFIPDPGGIKATHSGFGSATLGMPILNICSESSVILLGFRLGNRIRILKKASAKYFSDIDNRITVTARVHAQHFIRKKLSTCLLMFRTDVSAGAVAVRRSHAG
jgi:hypothetical protein